MIDVFDAVLSFSIHCSEIREIICVTVDVNQKCCCQSDLSICDIMTRLILK